MVALVACDEGTVTDPLRDAAARDSGPTEDSGAGDADAPDGGVTPDASVDAADAVPECDARTPCEDGLRCEAGRCVPGCGSGPACVEGERCEDGRCVLDGPYVGHEAILNQIVGYGREVTGGAGGALIEVSNTNNAGPGSLREALAVSGPTWIYFTPGLSGTIEAEGLMYVGSDTTIDGRGANIAIGGHTLNVYQSASRAEGADNVVLHNLRFSGDVPERRNLVRIRFGEGVWVDHVTFAAQAGDGKPLTMGDGVTSMTVSWCDFSVSEVSLIWLISSNNESPGDANIRITAHHNLFEGTSERHPRVRYATVHFLNNAVIDWGLYGSSISQEGFFFADSNVYEAGERATSAIITKIGNYPASGDPLMGNLRTVGNWWANGTVPPEERNPTSVPEPPYPYTAETADADLVARIRAGVGWQDVPSPFE